MSDSNLRKQSTSEEKQKRVTLATPLGKEELAVSAPNQRNWRGILIALLVIAAVLGLIVCSILLLSPPDDGPRVRGVRFSLESIAGKRFAPNLFNGTWISEIELVYRDDHGNVKMFCVENFTTKSLVTNTTFGRINAVDYKVSADLNYVLLATNVVKIWKHSFRAKYYVYEVATEEYFPLKATEEETEELPYLESADWAPTGNAIAFVYENNLYYKSRIRKPQVYTLTRNGMKNVFFNGRPDFLYETKIFESGTAFWFSSESTMLAFASFNCSRVGKIQIPHYGISEYEEMRTIRFPKSGTSNAKVELTIVNTTHPKILKTAIVQPPQTYAKDGGDYYLTGVAWIDARAVAVTWTNRKQNLASVSVCKQPDWTCTDIYQDKTRDDGWVDKIPNPIFDGNGTWFLAILPARDGTENRFRELCQVDSATRKFIYLTSPPMIVLEILAWDTKNHVVYFVAAEEPGTRHLFKTGDRTSPRRSSECLTCFRERKRGTTPDRPHRITTGGINETDAGRDKSYLVEVDATTSDPSPRCLFSKVYFNSIRDPKYYVVDCLGPEVPSSVIFETGTNSALTVLDSNERLRNTLRAMAVPQIRKFQVELESGYNARVRLFLPPGLREDEEMLFPLILNVDSSPGSQLVNEKFQVNWWWYLSTYRNFVVAEIDARGTGFQGEKLVRELNNKIGTAEVEDQMAVVAYLRDTLKFIDKHRMGIFGKGHGGYLAAMIMSQDKELFRCGIAVNPITSFLFTDTFSSEKYFGNPNDTENFRYYDEADLNKRAGKFKGKQFLLVSSTGDIEVPIQHSMNFVHNLVKENVLFKHQIYPDEDHDLTGATLHFYSLMDSFWNECFIPQENQDWETMDSFTPFSKE